MSGDQIAMRFLSESGVVTELTINDMLGYSNSVELHPDLFLDVQAETLDVFISDNPYDVIVSVAESVILKHPEYLPDGMTHQAITPTNITEISIALMVRLYAADELSSRKWMERVWVAGMSNKDVLPEMGRYFSKADLHFDEKLRILVFDEAKARAALSWLAD